MQGCNPQLTQEDAITAPALVLVLLMMLALTSFRIFFKSISPRSFDSNPYFALIFFFVFLAMVLLKLIAKSINQVQSNIQSRFSTNVNRLHVTSSIWKWKGPRSWSKFITIYNYLFPIHYHCICYQIHQNLDEIERTEMDLWCQQNVNVKNSRGKKHFWN